MAAILDAFAPYVQNLIKDMAKEEVSMLLGVSGEITKLQEIMETHKAFLTDAERKRITDKSVQKWVNKLKGAMYDATDILDLCQLEADKRRESTEDGSNVKEKVPAAGCFQSLLFCLRNPVFAHNIGSQIKELNQRLDDIHKEATKFNIIANLGSNLERQRTLTDAQRSVQKMTSEFDESAIIGEKIEADTKELAQLLISNDNHDVRVVSIVGTGGMGKTTLAQKIYNETTVQEQFKVKIWLSITQHFNEIELLKAAIKHAGGCHDGEHDKTLLTRILTTTLSTGRVLLVLDDMWGDEAWHHVFSIPIRKASQKQPGSWVLITTRLGDLAQRMRASFYQHTVSPLNEEDAWTLLNKQLPPPNNNQVVGTDHLRDVGMKIIRKCGGLPLAVKVMGGLLSTKGQTERDWESVLNHHAWSVDGLPEELDKRIYLSYEDLSPQLKQCFLYCSLFPKGTSIWMIEIVPMWISEGFVQPQGATHNDQLEEVAIEYHQELIMRNLLEPAVGSSLTGYECTMHDVVRSFAEFMAREDSLVLQDRHVVASGSNDGRLVRFLSVGPSELAPEWTALQKQESLRTLIINCKINYEPIDSLTSFSRLRVLSINGGDCDRLVGSLCHLRHLRYLCLEQTNISRLPEDICRMKFLQHLVLRGCGNLGNIPSSIIKLVHLRTLSITDTNAKFVIPKGFNELINLRTLFGFPVHVDMDRGWCSLEELGPLSQLRDLSLHGLENVPTSLVAKMARIGSKKHIDYLKLFWSSSGFMELRDEIEKQQLQHAVEEVLEKLCPPRHVQDLWIQGYFGRVLPNWMMVPSTGDLFKSLTILTLRDLPCCTKLPDGLCQLPSLKALDIINAPAIKSIEFDFQASLVVGGGVTATTAIAFPSLNKLSLRGLCEWEEWDWQEQQAVDVAIAEATLAMPALERLTIDNCKLSCLPSGLASSNRRALRELNLYELPNLTSVECLPSVVELDVFDCPKLKKISGLFRLHKIRIVRCPNVEVLEGVPSLDSLGVQDHTMEALPGYLQTVNPRYLELDCSKNLYELLSPGGSEWKKISHIGKHNINYK